MPLGMLSSFFCRDPFFQALAERTSADRILEQNSKADPHTDLKQKMACRLVQYTRTCSEVFAKLPQGGYSALSCSERELRKQTRNHGAHTINAVFRRVVYNILCNRVGCSAAIQSSFGTHAGERWEVKHKIITAGQVGSLCNPVPSTILLHDTTDTYADNGASTNSNATPWSRRMLTNLQTCIWNSTTYSADCLKNLETANPNDDTNKHGPQNKLSPLLRPQQIHALCTRLELLCRV